MINLIRADLYRIVRSKGIMICLAVATAAAIGYLWLAHLMAIGSLDPATTANSASVLSDVMVGYLLGSLLVGLVVCHDFGTKAVHDALLVQSRLRVAAGKTVVAIGTVVALLLPYAVAAVVGFISRARFELFLPTTYLMVPANPTGLVVDGSSISQAIAVIATTTLVYAARMSVCVPLAFLTRRPVVVMTVGFIWGFIADGFDGATAKIPVLKQALELTPYAGRHTLSLESSTSDLLFTTGVCVAFIVVMGAVSAWLFRRMEIK